MVKNDHEDRRSHLRILTRVLVDFDSPDTYLYDYSNDLSEGGIFIETENPFPMGTELALRFTLPNLERVFEMRGVVRWVTGMEASKTQPRSKDSRGMGIQFIDMAEADREMLKEYISKTTIDP